MKMNNTDWKGFIFLACLMYIAYYTLSGFLTAVGNIVWLITAPFQWLFSKLKK